MDPCPYCGSDLDENACCHNCGWWPGAEDEDFQDEEAPDGD